MLVQHLNVWMNYKLCMTIEMKAIEEYIHVVGFFCIYLLTRMFDFDVDHLLLYSSLTSNSRRHIEAEARPVILGAGM